MYLPHILLLGSKHSHLAPLDDGYRLTYGGLDYLALHTHLKRSTLYSTGNCIGVGKESDIYVCASPTGQQLIVKIHRLGRISFRSIKNNRDYLKHRTSVSWMHMSRLSALKEFSFMKVLKENGFRVPEPVAQNRHMVVMELVDAFPLRQISSVPDPAGLYAELIEIVMRLAEFGLIHGDFNEFNILIREDEAPREQIPSPQEDQSTQEPHPPPSEPPSRSPPTLTPVIIDFPQMVSIDHANAEMYFDRDINCIKRFFERRFNFVSDEPGPFFADARKLTGGSKKAKRLDVEVEASGFSKKMAKELEKYMQAVGVQGDGEDDEEVRRKGNDDADESDESDDPPAGSKTLEEVNGDGRENDETGNDGAEMRLKKLDQDVKVSMTNLSISSTGREKS